MDCPPPVIAYAVLIQRACFGCLQVFREELERIVESQLRDGYTPSNIQALQQVTDMLLPSSQKQRGCPLLPINDIRGVDGLRYSPPEKALRCKMAALCRLLDMYGWAAGSGQGQFTHATVRICQDQEHFLINPFGLLLHEVGIVRSINQSIIVFRGDSQPFSGCRSSTECS